MPNDFRSFLDYLVATNADCSEIATARTVFQRYAEWASSGLLPELQVAETRLAALFGSEGDGYLTVADLNGISGIGRKKVVKWAMVSLGFREESPYLNGVKTRVWVRGAGLKNLPRLTVPDVPPCPVPSPM